MDIADDDRPSKSARKREAQALQDLGVELAGLPAAELDGLGLPDALVGALAELRRLTAHGAQLRQRQYIGKLMRRIDAGPIRERLAARRQRHDEDVRRFQAVERWRDRLLAAGPDAATALDDLLADHPAADRALLARLIDRARHEQAAGRPPTATRELFASLRQLLC